MTQKSAPWLVFLSARAPPNQYPSARETRATVMREVQMKRLTPKGGPMILEPRSSITITIAPQMNVVKTRYLLIATRLPPSCPRPLSAFYFGSFAHLKPKLLFLVRGWKKILLKAGALMPHL